MIEILNATEAVIDGTQVMIGDAILADTKQANAVIKGLLLWHQSQEDARVAAINRIQLAADNAIREAHTECDSQREQAGQLLEKATAQITDITAQLQQSETMRSALMQGIRGFASGLPEGQQLLLRVLIDMTPGASEKIKAIERMQIEGSIAAMQAELDRLNG